MENYSKPITFGAYTMLDKASMNILRAITTYENEIAKTVSGLAAAGVDSASHAELLRKLEALYAEATEDIAALREAVGKARKEKNVERYGKACRDKVVPAMNALRKVADEMETLTAKKYWPFPTYDDLLFSVN